MFGRLFGSKTDRPAPAKGQLLLQCPQCGASQYEPKLVISTNCRTCGVHLSVQRGKVKASEQAPGNPQHRRADPPPLVPPPKRALKAIGAEGPLSQLSDSPALTGATSESARQPAEAAASEGFGAFLTGQLAQIQSNAEQAPKTRRSSLHSSTEKGSRRESNLGHGSRVDRSSKVRESPRPVDLWQQNHEAQMRHRQPPAAARVRSSPAAAATQAGREPTTLQRMREGEVYRRAYFKEAVCFVCQHGNTVNRSARQTICPHCGAAICLEDIEINLVTERPIQTRGDVLIRKRGELTCSLLECRDLRCIGLIHGDVQAANEACFGSDGMIDGRIRCRRFVVEKGANVQFTRPIQAEEAEVNARMVGQIECRGRLVIGKNGLVRGDVSAASVSIEPGGVLDGNIRIVTPYQPRPSQGPNLG